MEKKVNRKRDKSFYLRLTAEEKRKIEKLFLKSSCKSINEMILKVLLEGKYKVESNDRELDKLIYETRKIGVNLNQLAHAYNSRNKEYFAENQSQTLEKVKGLLERNIEILSQKLGY